MTSQKLPRSQQPAIKRPVHLNSDLLPLGRFSALFDRCSRSVISTETSCGRVTASLSVSNIELQSGAPVWDWWNRASLCGSRLDTLWVKLYWLFVYIQAGCVFFNVSIALECAEGIKCLHWGWILAFECWDNILRLTLYSKVCQITTGMLFGLSGSPLFPWNKCLSTGAYLAQTLGRGLTLENRENIVFWKKIGLKWVKFHGCQ